MPTATTTPPPAGCFASIADVLDRHGGSFRCIYADPPWQYQKTVGRGAAENHYGTMSVEAIQAMPIGELAAPESHLHLWTTTSFLRESFDVIEAWGFEYKSQIIWCKPQMGIGNYCRVSHEILMIAARGELPFSAPPPTQSHFVSPRRRHSEKPELFRELIETVSPAPRLELFGRKPSPGWVVFGNQIADAAQSRMFNRWEDE